jgi:hypothetical protein
MYKGLDRFDVGQVEETCCGFLERLRLLFRRRHDHDMSAEWDIQPAIAAVYRAAGLAEAPEKTAVEIERSEE